jgi:hypothetical protein
MSYNSCGLHDASNSSRQPGKKQSAHMRNGQLKTDQGGRAAGTGGTAGQNWFAAELRRLTGVLAVADTVTAHTCLAGILLAVNQHVEES